MAPGNTALCFFLTALLEAIAEFLQTLPWVRTDRDGPWAFGVSAAALGTAAL